MININLKVNLHVPQNMKATGKVKFKVQAIVFVP